MKTRLFVFLVLLLAVIGFWWLWRSALASKIGGHTNQLAVTAQKTKPSLSTETLQAPHINKAEFMSALLAATSKEPIVFFGKVIDQDGNAVIAASVRGEALAMTQWMADVKADGHYTTTDGNGFFNFQGLHGQSLSIFISKDGYEFGYNVTGFNYSPMFDKRDVYQPNASAPEVFKMWKLRGPEPLISAEKLFGIKGDGTPFTIDLLKARKIEGRVASGDLVVKANQPTQIASGQRFDWSFDIDVIDGGLIEATNGQYNNEAPAEGYKPSISGAMKAGDREWSDEVTKRLFIKSRNGEQFAIVTVEVIADYHGSVAFGVKYLVNPKPGSRNLEYDPYKRLKPR